MNQKPNAAQLQTMMVEATAYHRRGELGPAEILYRNLLDADAKNFNAAHMLAVLMGQKNHVQESLTLFKKAKKLNSSDARLFLNYGVVLRKAKRYQDAVDAYDQALQLQPRFFDALFNKAQCYLHHLQKPEVAADLCRLALEIMPNDAETLAVLGGALNVMGQSDAAIEKYEQAIQSNPNIALPYISMATFFRDRDWLTPAIMMYERALAIEPQNPTARTHLSLTLLRNGELAKGWKEYEGRFKYVEELIVRRPIPPPYWAGEDLTGKSIVVWPEQGVGDEILLSSMLPQLAALAERVVYECDPRMLPVFKRSFPTVDTRAWAERDKTASPASEFHYQIPLGSVGQFFRSSFSDFPKHTGYLKADPDNVSKFRARYGAGPLVGISWRSSNEKFGPGKTLSLDVWEPILRQPGITFVSLQYGDVTDDIAQIKDKFGIEIINDPEVDSLRDLDTFFAQVEAMDLVVSTSNTTVHVAGALGKPTWALMPAGLAMHWYWFLRRVDSPWYPSMRLYRQDRAGDWSGAVELVAAALSSWASAAGRA